MLTLCCLSQVTTLALFHGKRSSGAICRAAERAMQFAHAVDSDADATSIKRLLTLR
jgi:hypothetical protein